MRLFLGLLLLLPVAGTLAAESWEMGVGAGYGVCSGVDVSGATGSAKTGCDRGAAFTAVLGQDISRHVGGEIRYTYRLGDLKVSSGSTQAKASGEAHAIHYDFLLHATPTGSVVRPYVAAGAGAKVFRGTGAEPPFQPLSDFVVLTHTTQTEALISFGGGLKIAISRRALLRFDFRDYFTPVPDNVLASPMGISGWMHDFVGMVGVSGSF